jgi:hypothetical protein
MTAEASRSTPTTDVPAGFTLEDIAIPIACNVPWETMRGDARTRFCGECKLHVYNVAALSRAEAETLIRESGGEVCVRLFQRPDGTVVTKSCLDVLAAARRRARIVLAAVLGVVGFAASALAGWLVHLGGLNAPEAWERQPLKAVEPVIPEALIPRAPVIMGRICFTPPPVVNAGALTPSSTPDPAVDASPEGDTDEIDGADRDE